MARKTFKAGDTLAPEDIRPGMKVSRRQAHGYDWVTIDSFRVASVEKVSSGMYAFTPQGASFRMSYAPTTYATTTLDEDFTDGDFEVGDEVSGEDYMDLPRGALVYDLEDQGPFMRTADGFVSTYGAHVSHLAFPRTIVYLPPVVAAYDPRTDR